MRDLKRCNAKTPAYKMLQDLKFEVFTPMKWHVATIKGEKIRKEIPVIPDLLFVHSNRADLDPIVTKTETLQYRFLRGTWREPMTVRESDMEWFIHSVNSSESVKYYLPEELAPENENTPFHPYSPYAVAKLYGFWIVKEYREAYNMFACSGILFNHESERRGETFVTRKITLAAARIAQGKQEKLYLGNLSSLRDWGYAKDYVECMWLILQQPKPEDFVIATGEQHSVREFCLYAFRRAGIDIVFEGEGENEKGIDKKTGKVVIEVSPDFYRPTDVVNLWGDPSKAKAELGWDPTKKTSFEQLVNLMVDADMAKVAVERASETVRTNLAEYLEKGIVK